MNDYLAPELDNAAILAISAAGLAHVGDAVLELMVRTWLCEHGKATNHGLHRAAVRYVSATAQAAAMERLLPCLTEEEQQLYHRGRNAHTHAAPKGATPGQYARATGMETLFGGLYLTGRRERVNALFALMMEAQDAV